MVSNIQITEYGEANMTLTAAWFRASAIRYEKREKNGITLEEIRDAFRYIDYGPLAPIAMEVVEWLYTRWSLKQLGQLEVIEIDYILRRAEVDSWPGVRVARQKRRQAYKARMDYISPLAAAIKNKANQASENLKPWPYCEITLEQWLQLPISTREESLNAAENNMTQAEHTERADY